jgi:hypothetical protein
LLEKEKEIAMDKKQKVTGVMMDASEIGNLLFMAVRRSFREGAEETNKMFAFMKKYAKGISQHEYGCLQRDAVQEVQDDWNWTKEEKADIAHSVIVLGAFCRAGCRARGAADWPSLVEPADVLGPIEDWKDEFADIDFGPEPKDEKMEISQDDLMLLAKKAFVYAIGRRTYVSSMCEDFAKAHAKDMISANAAALAWMIAMLLPRAYGSQDRGSCDVESFQNAQKYFEEATVRNLNA